MGVVSQSRQLCEHSKKRKNMENLQLGHKNRRQFTVRLEPVHEPVQITIGLDVPRFLMPCESNVIKPHANPLHLRVISGFATVTTQRKKKKKVTCKPIFKWKPPVFRHMATDQWEAVQHVRDFYLLVFCISIANLKAWGGVCEYKKRVKKEVGGDLGERDY